MKLIARTLISIATVASPLAAQRGGQQLPPPTPIDSSIVRRSGAGFVVNFDDQPLRVVFSALAEASGLNIVQTNIPLRNTTLHMGQAVTREQMLEVIKGIAASNGIAVVEGPTLVRLEGVAQVAQPNVQQLAQQAQLQAQQQLFIYRLKHASAVQLAPVLQTLFSGLQRGITTQAQVNANPLAALLGLGGGAGGGGFAPVGGAAGGGGLAPIVAGGGAAGGGAAGGGAAGGGAAGGGAAGAGAADAAAAAAAAGRGGGGAGRGAGRGAAVQALAQAQTASALSAAAADIRVVAEESSNSLIIRATQADYQLIQTVLGGVDLRPLQVLIEVTIAEVTRTHDLNYGLSGTANNKPKTGNGTTGTATQPSQAGTDDFLLALTGGKGTVNFNVAINALQSRGDVRVLSLPVIIAENNRQAILNVGSSRPFVQISQTVPNDPTGRVQTVQYIDVGTVLTITPTINPDGYVNLQISQTDNSATNEIAFDAPVINKREATTQIFIHDGQTTVIGGLADNSDSKTRTGIPYLSQIPIIGWLFGSHVINKETSELFLFLTPHVIFSDDDIDKLREAVKNGSELLQTIPTGARIRPGTDTISVPLIRPDSAKAKTDTIKKKPPTA